MGKRSSGLCYTKPATLPPRRFPYFGVAVLLPCALLAAAGFKVLATGAVLVVFEVFDSASLIWAQLSMLLLYGYKPNELVVKRLAIMGCVALVLANSVQERHLAMSSYAGGWLRRSQEFRTCRLGRPCDMEIYTSCMSAMHAHIDGGWSRGRHANAGGPGTTATPRAAAGLLVSSDKKETSRRKSTVLLLGRLLLCALFIYVGIVQVMSLGGALRRKESVRRGGRGWWLCMCLCLGVRTGHERERQEVDWAICGICNCFLAISGPCWLQGACMQPAPWLTAPHLSAPGHRSNAWWRGTGCCLRAYLTASCGPRTATTTTG